MCPTHHDRHRQWADAAAKQIVDLHLTGGSPKPLMTSRVADLIVSNIVLALMEEREAMLTPGEN